MKKLLAVGLALALSGCGGGFDDMDAARPGGGIGNTGSDNNQPSNPEEKTQWQYSSTSNSSGIFSLRANNYALNFFYDPQFSNVKHKPWIELEKRKSSSGAVTSTVVIFVNSNLSCTPSCKVGMTFDVIVLMVSSCLLMNLQKVSYLISSLHQTELLLVCLSLVCLNHLMPTLICAVTILIK